MAILPFEGHMPQLATPCWVADSATVVGMVSVGRHASIWYGVTMRGDIASIAIGDNTNIQDNSIVHVDTTHPTVVEEWVTVGHGVILHGCHVGKGSLIGMGAILLNGCHIGENCVIGAGALIPEGKQIPPRSVVLGSPGKIVREVSDDDIVRIRANAERYVQLWQRHHNS